MLKLTKSFIETVYHSARVIFRTVRVTIAEEVELSRLRAKARYECQTATNARIVQSAATPSLAESLDIIGVEDIKDPERIQQRYQQLFEANDRVKGGSFYLQSKVVRAKERIDTEVAKMAATASETELSKAAENLQRDASTNDKDDVAENISVSGRKGHFIRSKKGESIKD